MKKHINLVFLPILFLLFCSQGFADQCKASYQDKPFYGAVIIIGQDIRKTTTAYCCYTPSPIYKNVCYTAGSNVWASAGPWIWEGSDKISCIGPNHPEFCLFKPKN